MCGIVINEIITNTLKYAFSDTVPVKIISISIQKKLNGEIHLLIGDNGIGLPTNFELSTSKTLGMQLIHGLSNQLGGKIEMLRENGLVYEISFQLNKA